MAADDRRARTYICIDLKSYYASVECVLRGLDPLKTNLLVADESRSDQTICLAVSPSLKALGVPGRPRLFEAKQKIREAERRLQKKIEYITATPRMQVYIDQSAEIYGIYLDFVSMEDIHVYSIDECFIDVTGYLGYYGCSARELAMRMIRSVLRRTGITATAGIGPNMYLAKIAMDIVAKKSPPDADGVRIAELDEASYRTLLWNHYPLSDFWQISAGTIRRLSRMGILSMGDLARYSLVNEDGLYREFGIDAELLIDHAGGIEPCLMEDIKNYNPNSNSLSNGQVLPRPYKYSEGGVIIREMSEILSLDLVRKNLVTATATIQLGLDYKSPNSALNTRPVPVDFYGRLTPRHARATKKLKEPTDSEQIITGAFLFLYHDEKKVDRSLLIRRLSLCANNVKENPGFFQLDMFTDYEAQEHEKNLKLAVLAIKQKYGRNAVLKGTSLMEGATTRQRNEQIGGHRA